MQYLVIMAIAAYILSEFVFTVKFAVGLLGPIEFTAIMLTW